MARTTSARPSRAHPSWSGLLLFTLAVAVIATLGFVLTVVLQGLARPGPPPFDPSRPPPPPHLTAVIVMAALFILSWGAVAFAYLRDQLAHRFAELTDRILELTAEYGEQRETDGYLHGYRQAGGGAVRSLHPVPPAE